MKKILVGMFIVILMVSVGACIAFANTLEENGKGDMRIVEEPASWRQFGTITKEAGLHTKEALEAVKNPGEIIPLGTYMESRGMESLFYLKGVTATRAGIMYDTSSKKVDVVNGPVVLKSELLFNPFLCFWFFSVIIMIRENIFHVMTAGFFSFFITCGLFVTTFFTVPSGVYVLISSIILGACIVIVDENSRSSKMHHIASGLYYVVEIFLLVYVYRPLLI